MAMLATRKTKDSLGTQLNEGAAGGYSDFAKRMLGKMGWKEGQ